MNDTHKQFYINTNCRDLHLLLFRNHIIVEERIKTINHDHKPEWHLLGYWPNYPNGLKPHETTILAQFRKLYGCFRCKHTRQKTACEFCHQYIYFTFMNNELEYSTIKVNIESINNDK